MNKKMLSIAIMAAMSPSISNVLDGPTISTGAKGSKYKPHQGTKECARRKSKIK